MKHRKNSLLLGETGRPLRNKPGYLLLAWGAGLGLILTAMSLSSCGQSQSASDPGTPMLDDSHNPYRNFRGGDINGEKNFAFLINNYLQAKTTPTPWAGFWWPYTGNGIASGIGGGGSPAGKYDAARGHTTQAQAWEARNHGAQVPHIQGWWGHCNGWCAAAGLFQEPTGPVTVNGIEFGIADIKGLLTEAGMSTSADFYGNRVDYGQDYDSPKYWDVVPDQYLLVLTNYIGKLNQAVLIDRYTGDQIWNQPLAGYKIEYPTPADYVGADPQHPGIYKINVTSTIWWREDGVQPDVQTPEFDYQDDAVTSSRELKMEVWLDGPVVFDSTGKITSAGNVVVTRDPEHPDYYAGGAWLMGGGYQIDAWPDYMWVPYSMVAPDPNDDYANPYVDINWIKAHLLVPGGADDPSAHGGNVDPVPSPHPWPSNFPTYQPTPGTGTPQPWPTFTNFPDPNPWPTSTSVPIPWPFPHPTSTHSH